jgi:hypothetical protein
VTVRDYNYSRPLDVHRWSEHPESNIFVDEIYNDAFKTNLESKEYTKYLMLIKSSKTVFDELGNRNASI